MYQPRRAIPPREREQFILAEDFKGPSDISPELLADLHDCAFKFGVGDASGRTRAIASPDPPITVAVNPDPEITTILVSAGSRMTEDAYLGKFAGNGFLWWDKHITVEQVIAFIKQVDTFFEARGWLDPATGMRTRRVNLVDRKPLKRSVEDTFRIRGAVFPVVSPYQNGEELRNEFDHPERLVLLRNPIGGGESLCHIRDREQIEDRQRRAIRALAQLGYTDLTKLPTSVEEILALRKRIDEMLQNNAPSEGR